MNYRQLGKTGLKVSEVGFGAWGIGKMYWIGANDDESLKALHRSIELGLNFIDTAIGYGEGHSEKLIGQVVKQHNVPIYVASKIPPKNYIWPAQPGTHADEAFPSEHIFASTEQSLKNLDCETIDIMQFHVWSDEWVGQGEWLDAIQRMKEQGKIRYFGVSINNYENSNVIELVKSGVVDTVQLIYNIFDQTAEDELFPACEQYNVGVIVRVPLDEGGLTGAIKPDTTFAEGDFRNSFFQGDRKREVFERVNRIVEDLSIAPDEIAETALRFTLSHPAVSTVIPGMRSVRNVERNMAVSDGRALPQEKLTKLKKHQWIRDFYS